MACAKDRCRFKITIRKGVAGNPSTDPVPSRFPLHDDTAVIRQASRSGSIRADVITKNTVLVGPTPKNPDARPLIPRDQIAAIGIFAPDAHPCRRCRFNTDRIAIANENSELTVARGRSPSRIGPDTIPFHHHVGRCSAKHQNPSSFVARDNVARTVRSSTNGERRSIGNGDSRSPIANSRHAVGSDPDIIPLNHATTSATMINPDTSTTISSDDVPFGYGRSTDLQSTAERNKNTSTGITQQAHSIGANAHFVPGHQQVRYPHQPHSRSIARDHIVPYGKPCWILLGLDTRSSIGQRAVPGNIDSDPVALDRRVASGVPIHRNRMMRIATDQVAEEANSTGIGSPNYRPLSPLFDSDPKQIRACDQSRRIGTDEIPRNLVSTCRLAADRDPRGSI